MNVPELERTIAALDLSEADSALVAACRSLAAAVDEDPGKASLWREYREALSDLMARGAGDGDGGDALAAFMASVRTPVLDSEDA